MHRLAADMTLRRIIALAALLAALAAPAMGALHEVTGGWDAVLLASLVVVLAYCVLLVAAVIVSWRAPR